MLKAVKSFLIAILILSIGCHATEKNQFELLKENVTNLHFENILHQTADFNYFNYMYFFNGGGTITGDFNNDGLPDLFFTSNMGPNKMFLNEGRLTFQDVSEDAGIEGLGGWTSGATVVDINYDGMLDIYVSQLGDYETIKGRNQLYVCLEIKDGIPVYEDQAFRYGLALVGFSTQAAFFDVDLDGDLDMFQLNHSLHQNGTFGQKKTFEGTQHPKAGDKLMINEDGRFIDRTIESGIKSTVIGYGLGIAIGDVNLDGWPDIYVGNDFHEDDYLYINNRDGTFKEVGRERLMHTSRFSMGVDIGDINNDGFNDLFSLDMLPDDPSILKKSQGENTLDVYSYKLRFGYGYQYARNNLQLNDGNGAFREIGLFAGVSATDWSWASLLMDFDNDGYKDIFISNGIPRRMNDLDYINFRANHDLKYKSNTNNLEESDLVFLDKMPRNKVENRFFKNMHNLQFKDIGLSVKDPIPSFSNGAVYVDLDMDGDLDIITNNNEEAPFVYKNLTRENGTENSNFLFLQLNGSTKNTLAIGAKVIIFKNEQKILTENFPVRGFQSCGSPDLFVGLGDTMDIDSILLIWPDRSYQRITDPVYNQVIKLQWVESLPVFDFNTIKSKQSSPYSFSDVSKELGINYQHEENEYLDFNREFLIPHMVSSEGPAMAIGDVNGDGLEDVFLGSSKRRHSRIYLQTAYGKFQESTPNVILQDSIYEDVDAVFVDIENDGDLDLVVASGGNEFWGKHEALLQRVYVNDGKGNFTVEKTMFGETYMTASCVLPTDFNQDGLTDFFFGGRAVPWNYGKTPRSYLFENKGNGKFIDVTTKYSEGLSQTGMVKNGRWYDMDEDGDQDLVLAVEWHPVQIYLNENNHFTKLEIGEWKGWWNFVLPYDFDGDGDVDILAGNTGKNTKLKPDFDHPIRLYVNDFDENEQIEQILTYYLGGREIPFATYEELTKQLPNLKKKFLYAKDFSEATLDDLVGSEKLADSEVLEVNTLQSVYFENTGNKFEYKKHDLPDELQFSTLNTALIYDVHNDGSKEILIGENFYGNNVEMGRSDAGFGHILTIMEGTQFSISSIGSIAIKGQVMSIKLLNSANGPFILFAKNNDSLQIISPQLNQVPTLDTQKIIGQ